ncbi:MAG: efflux RND transporter permease subunit [Rhodanobacteraceae bacterium]
MNLPELATRRRVTIGMLTLTLVLFGLIGLAGLKVNLLPDLAYPTLTVRTEYPGAAPLEMEKLVTRPVEESMGVVKNVRKVHSVSHSGQSDVILEFAWGTDMDMASLDVRDKLDTLTLPQQARRPLLLRFNPSNDPIIRLGLSDKAAAAADQSTLKRLRRFADEELKKRLEPIEGVAAVKTGGGLEDEIQVDIDQQKLARLGIEVSEVADRLSKENVNLSGGRVDQGNQRFLVRTVNQFQNLEQMRQLLIKVDHGVPIQLGDIATVKQGFKERQGVVRIDGHEAIELAIYKEGDANTVAVAGRVRDALARIDKQLPRGATLTTIEDQSVFIRHALDEVRNDALIGGLLAILIIFFFLGHGWSTFIVSLSLPVSLIATFFFMDQFGLSLNVMSLGGLALATGMVVDDSIVVLENIARERERGASILQSAIRGAGGVGMAVTASTLTTVAVFFPLVFVRGVAGQLFRDQALTISFAMLISLLVAMTLIPMLAALKGRSPLAYQEESQTPGPHGLLGVLPRVWTWVWLRSFAFLGRILGRVLGFVGQGVMRPYAWLARGYHRLLPRALAHPWRVLATAGALLLASLAVLPTLGMDLIPPLAQNRFEMTAILPPGTPLANTDRLVRTLALQHASDPGVASIYGVAGNGTRLDANPTESGENIARLSVALTPGAGKSAEAAEIKRLRVSLHDYPNVEAKFSRPRLFSFAAPLEVELHGYDLDALRQAGERLTGLMQKSPRFTDIESTVSGGYPEIRIHFDQARAAALGLTSRQIADRVVDRVKGEVATRYNVRDLKVDVLVRARPSDRNSLSDIRNLVVGYVSSDSNRAGTAADAAGLGADGNDANGLAQTAGTPIRLSAVANIVVTEGPSEIHRISQERVAIVSAGLSHGDLASAVAEVRSLIAAHPLAAGVSASIGGQSEELHDSVNSLLFALALAIFLVYLVMASQFESLLHPLVIMFSIPLAAVGAIAALKLTGSSLSVVVFIGLIMLVGIVVKNAIVLIDRVNQLREQGVAKLDALAQAAESRLRPIVMTTLCTLIGFLPLAIGVGEGAEVRAPMAITVIGGLAVSTLLTLLVIPVVYDLLDRRADAWYTARGERRNQSAAAPDGAGAPTELPAETSA